MRDLSTDELAVLGDLFGVPVESEEAEEIRAEVDDLLASLEGLEELPLPGPGPTSARGRGASRTTTPDVAPRVEDAVDPGFDYGRNTRAADVTRLPAVSLPNGTHDGLPVGFQMVGEAFGDADLLGAAAAVAGQLSATSA